MSGDSKDDRPRDSFWFEDDLEAARRAKTARDVLSVVKGLEKRVHSAGSAIAVDSAYQILRALRMSLEANALEANADGEQLPGDKA